MKKSIDPCWNYYTYLDRLPVGNRVRESEAYKLCSESFVNKYEGYYNCSIPNKELKTTKISLDKCSYITQESIENYHDAQPTLAFLMGMIPGCGPLFSALYSISVAAEQQDAIEVSNACFGEAIGAAVTFLKSKYKSLGYAYDAIQAAGALNEWITPSGIDSYVVDGHRVYAGDAFVQITLKYDLGLTTQVYQVWLRNNVPIVKEITTNTSSIGGPFTAWEQGIRRDWIKDGYVTEEEYRNG